MEVMHEICAGLDVHKENVVACVRMVRGGKVERETKTFRTETQKLVELFDWLAAKDCTHVVMESTGVYWKPVWRVLEGGFELVLANASAVKNVPGRKSDVSDAQWLADLLAHGLVRGSLAPDENGQDLRDLTRTRKQLVREQVQHRQRIQKLLERATSSSPAS
jgi:transposase